jgi:hypothetical protein
MSSAFAYVFRFGNEFSDEVFNMCPDVDDTLKVLVVEAYEKLQLMMRYQKGGTLSTNIDYNGRLFVITLTI